MVPMNARKRRIEVEKRMRCLEAFAESFPENRMEIDDSEVGIITAGMPYNYAKDVFPNYSYLKLGMVWPLPRNLIGEFFKKVNPEEADAADESANYSFWTENPNNGASMTLGPDGNYSTRWNNTLNFTAGKGWAVGSPDRVVCFEGSYDGGSNGFLALYGWTKDPLIEYYVCEKHGDWEPPGNTAGVQYHGTYTCDGGTYKIYTGWRENKPSIIGNASLFLPLPIDLLIIPLSAPSIDLALDFV